MQAIGASYHSPVVSLSHSQMIAELGQALSPAFQSLLSPPLSLPTDVEGQPFLSLFQQAPPPSMTAVDEGPLSRHAAGGMGRRSQGDLRASAAAAIA